MKKKLFICCISLLLVCGITCGTIFAFQAAKKPEDETPAFIALSETRYIDETIPDTKIITTAPLHVEEVENETPAEETELTYDYTDTEVENKVVDVYHDDDNNQYFYEDNRLQYYENSLLGNPNNNYLRDKSVEITELQAIALANKHMEEWYGDALDGFIMTSSKRGTYTNEPCYRIVYERLGGQGDFITIEWAECNVTIYGELYQSCVITNSALRKVTADDLAHLKQSTLESWAIKQFQAEHPDLFEKYGDKLTVSGYGVCYIDKVLSIRTVVYMGRMDYYYYYPL